MRYGKFASGHILSDSFLGGGGRNGLSNSSEREGYIIEIDF